MLRVRVPTMSSEAISTGATPKEEYDLLYGLMKESYAGLIDFELKHGAVLSVISGWFITSDKARDFLANNPISLILILMVLVSLTYFHTRWVKVYKRRSDHAFEQLTTLKFMPRDFLMLNAIPDSSVRNFILFHIIVTICICLMVVAATVKI
jgi:hypothetical protein